MGPQEEAGLDTDMMETDEGDRLNRLNIDVVEGEGEKDGEERETREMRKRQRIKTLNYARPKSSVKYHDLHRLQLL